jgi:hypothetical protein
VDAVDAGTLPREAWNHRAHLAAALVTLRRVGLTDAVPTMRRVILRYNAAVGIENTVDAGYHETLTSFYVHLVSHHMVNTPSPASLSSDVNALVEQWGARDLPLQYFTRERLFSRSARATALAPDLLPLPPIPERRS